MSIMAPTRLATVPMPWDQRHPWPIGPEVSFVARGEWPARWISVAAAEVPVVAAYRLRLVSEVATTVRVFASGDERYELFLDGRRIGRGPERGDHHHWYYDAYDLDLVAGAQVLVARVWSQGVKTAPWSQLGIRHGFLLAAADADWNERLATGVAPWQGKRLTGLRWQPANHTAWASDEVIDATTWPWGHEDGDGEDWEAVTVQRPGRSAAEASFVHTFEQPLRPGRLPRLRCTASRPLAIRAVEPVPNEATAAYADQPDTEACARWEPLLRGEAVTVPAQTTQRVLLDCRTYRNVYPHLHLRGGEGATVAIAFAEALYLADGVSPHDKGDRDAVAGKIFPQAGGATIRCDGGARVFSPLWWRAGRYLQLSIATADEPLTIADLVLEDTGYPYPEDGRLELPDEALTTLMRQCLRTARRCTHESFMDCPYYEQQQWVGDMRLQALVAHVVMRDDRLTRRCIEFIGDSRDGDGPVFGRHPAPQRLWIPAFALAWCGMVHDHARWRQQPAFTIARLPALRATLDWVLRAVDDAGILRVPAGWNFIDWAGWPSGEPAAPGEPGALLHWWLVWVLAQAAELEDAYGEPEFAARYRRHRLALARTGSATWWHEGRSLLAEDAAGTRFAELTNALALLGGSLDPAQAERCAEALATVATGPGDPAVTRCALAGDHYLFDAFARTGRVDALLKRLAPYRRFTERGLYTTLERDDPSRSDCHAWSAHPRYHLAASIAGIRPDAFGFTQVRIQPQLAGLPRITASVPHPSGGVVAVALRATDAGLQGQVELPPGVTGTLVLPSGEQALSAGVTAIA